MTAKGNSGAVARGTGLCHPPQFSYTQETCQLLKAMMEDSKLSSFHKRQLIDSMKRDLEKEKERLQDIFANGKEAIEKRKKQQAAQPPEPPPSDPEPDRFEELVKEVRERQEFLADMQALGQGKRYQGIILTEISQKLREMEEIDQRRNEALQEALRSQATQALPAPPAPCAPGPQLPPDT